MVFRRMETKQRYNTIRIFFTTRTSISITDMYISMTELLEILKYLNWIRSSKYGTFEAIRYNGKGLDYLDTIISERTRSPLFTFNFLNDEG